MSNIVNDLNQSFDAIQKHVADRLADFSRLSVDNPEAAVTAYNDAKRIAKRLADVAKSLAPKAAVTTVTLTKQPRPPFVPDENTADAA